MTGQTYALITPARNEEEFIGATIRSIGAQTIPPVRWAIVSDGSTDGTDDIVREYAREFPFIRLVRLESGEKRSFSSKVFAFQAGYDALEGAEYRFIGNLDADITLDSDYFARILKRFDADDRLGIASGWVEERENGVFTPRTVNRTHVVPGAAQLFRRGCFEQVGGYEPNEFGGEDTVACLRAEMNDWMVQSFTDIPIYHHRFTGVGQGGRLAASFKNGFLEYGYRYHPLFELSKFLFRLGERPVVASSTARLLGYVWGALKRIPRTLPDDIIAYNRERQLKRLSHTIPFIGRNKQ